MEAANIRNRKHTFFIMEFVVIKPTPMNNRCDDKEMVRTNDNRRLKNCPFLKN